MKMTLVDPAQFILWGGSGGLWRTLVFGTVAYFALVVMLRLTGKRTLSKMNAFDLIVTVALGSTLASVLLDSSVPLMDGLTALGLLAALQFVITWASVRSAVVRRLVKSEPTLLAKDGDYLHSAMRIQRVTKDEIDAAIRSGGFGALADVRCVVLETDGKLSVIR
jgi:uncharacterized membrane protein YcaP (DUF421 family)